MAGIHPRFPVSGVRLEIQDREVFLVSVLGLVLILGGCTTLPTEDDALAASLSRPGNNPASIYTQLGLEYIRTGQYDTALIKLRRALELAPDSADANSAMAILHERLGETKQAENYYRRSIELAPRNPYHRNAWASFLCQRGRFDEADREFRAALTIPIYRTPWVALTNAGTCQRQQGNLDAAGTYFRQALEANPVFTPLLYQMAELKLAQGDHLAAKAFLTRYFAQGETSPQALRLGIAIEQQLTPNEQPSADMQSYQRELRTRFPQASEPIF